MSELLAAAAQALGAPEALVERSAAARAAATGSTVEEVLAAWAGGEAVAAPPAAPAPVAEPAAAPAPVAEPAAPEPAVPEPVPVAAATLVEPEPAPPAEEPVEVVEPAPLGERLRVAGRLGALGGAMLGIVGALLASPLLLQRAAVVGEPGATTAVVEVGPVPTVVVVAAVSALFGALIGLASAKVPAWFRADLALRVRPRSAVLAGVTSGVVLGVVGAALILTLAGDATATEGVVAVGVRTAAVLLVAGGALLGALTAWTIQIAGMPATLSGEEALETEVVRRRLASSVLLPLAATLTVIVVVVAVGTLLLEYAAVAPLVAIVIAGSILLFAGLAGSRPGIKVSAGEVLVAAAGVGVIVLLIVLIAAVRGGGEHAEEPGDHAYPVARLL